ncbi:hypothetical protein [Hymenobacter cellulosivorans]|uniref:Uncharacterized protein n=1 Tax=Hymenobacter cellulosivorans TaxID=2932249 RepID=A0ABY4FD62_9BACT|nr:hypothetical protein [Hymenobacter cellulosivorans]UOQ52406.1 hypothetical protein MUN80_21970 [Hymenobacter cellulosivorans]
MTHPYRVQRLLRWCLLFVAGLLLPSLAMAQSGPYGNEWIVPNQQYYKIKISKNGIYHLDYNYLTRAGISGVNPQRFQLWRRGKEVAIYVGPNNPTTLTTATFIEFYGQRNDGALDVGMYKNARDHHQKFYSLYTDTASYFLTWSATTNGKRITPSNLAPVGGSHPYWLNDSVHVRTDVYTAGNELVTTYQPWGEAGEGFLSPAHGQQSAGGNPMPYRRDLLPVTSSLGPDLQVELILTGATANTHELTVTVEEPGTAVKRPLGPPS